jgi:hypothetical protein
MDDPTTLIEGADRLLAIYGSWISFHDAAVESVVLERVGPTVTIHFRTNDVPLPDDGNPLGSRDSRIARVVMRWHEVQDVVINGLDWDENNWIDGLTFVPRGESICTVIEPMDGTRGYILSRRVEVVSAEPLGHPVQAASGG